MSIASPRPGIFAELDARGLVHTSTDPHLPEILDQSPVTLYCGFDPTAPSLQVGNLVPLLTLARFQRFGHRPIVVLGGGTGMIGDPSGKNAERNLLDRATLAQNIAAQAAQFESLLDFSDSDASARMVNNFDWLGELGLIEFLRDIGKHMPMSVMLGRESVARRIGSPAGISYTEFAYQALQAFDFLHLFRDQGCRLQIGGSDQLGNIVAGTDLIRRTLGPSEQVFGLVFPLLETRSGQKMGKTAQGTVWLDTELTPVIDFYQYWFNFADDDVLAALKVFTFCPLSQIEETATRMRSDPAARVAQRLLADSVTTLVHGHAACAAARAQQDLLFGNRSTSVSDQRADLTYARSQLEAGIELRQVLLDCQLADSLSAARRLLSQGAVRVNDQRRERGPVRISDLDQTGLILIAAGKRHRRLIGLDEQPDA